MSLLPKEHGAYGQIAFPLVTSFAVAGVSIGGLLIAAVVVAAFVAHEPAAVLLGLRGVRARREQRDGAVRWVACCLVAGIAAGTAALLVLPAVARWSLALPLAPALVLAVAMVRGREKSGHGEVAAALAFAAAAVPVCLAAGTPVRTAAAVSIPFALLFVASTLAVRVVILRVRGGGNPAATAATRRAAYRFTLGATGALIAATAAGALPGAVLLAAIPGLAIATAVAAYPPAPNQLRTLGWTLVAVSMATAVLVAATA